MGEHKRLLVFGHLVCDVAIIGPVPIANGDIADAFFLERYGQRVVAAVSPENPELTSDDSAQRVWVREIVADNEGTDCRFFGKPRTAVFGSAASFHSRATRKPLVEDMVYLIPETGFIRYIRRCRVRLAARERQQVLLSEIGLVSPEFFQRSLHADCHLSNIPNLIRAPRAFDVGKKTDSS